MKTAWILLAATLCTASGAKAQEKTAQPAVDFAAVTARGHALYEYDQAAWHGTDAVFALKPEMKGLAHYICVKTPTGWLVYFPRWDEAHERLTVIYEAREKNGKFVARKLEKPAQADDDLVARERGLELAITDFSAPKRPYNSAVLPAGDGRLFVYLYPGQTRENVFPLGGDIRYTISADGKTIVEKRKLHNVLLDYPVKGNQKAGYHTHDVTDVPEDTDVLYVLNRKPAMEEFVGTSRQLFTIDKEGNIRTEKQ